jgi:hypothetical protein
MKAVRIMLFSLLAATVAGVVALIVTSNVERGPALSFHLVPERSATSSELRTDAAAMVRRLQDTGYSDTQAQVTGNSIEVTMYGSAPKLRSALSGALAPALVQLRPVSCAAPQANSGLASGLAPARLVCAAPYRVTASALQVDITTGRPTRQIGPDPDLAAYPTTGSNQDSATAVVLLGAGADSGFSGERLVCGPAGVTNTDFASASAASSAGNWVVLLGLTVNGVKGYDALARRQFHAYIGIDVDGTVVSASITEPKSASFTAPSGEVQIRGGFTRSQALNLANDLASPLAVPLELVQTTR